RSNLEKT
ncbi:RNA polymerase-binding transcription factor DksA, partial [Haemophilus influenzae]